MDDGLWSDISTLAHLRSLSFHALTYFSYEGIMDYVSKLRPTNAGLQLSIMGAALSSGLNDGHKADIRKALAEKVDGKFDYLLYADGDDSDDSNDSLDSLMTTWV